jgi:lysophospholipase L1-like esterase
MGFFRHPRRYGSFAVVVSLIAAFASGHAATRFTEDTPTTPAPREGAWMEMHNAFLKRAQMGEIDLLFLGDSITQGWNPGGKAVWERFYGPRKAANFGIGGDRTQHVLWRLDHGEVDGIHPKVVVLMIGTNNLDSDAPNEIADGVTAIVKSLRSKLPETRVLLLGIFPRDENPSARRERLKSVNMRIAKLDDGKMVKYLDIGKHFLNDDGTLSKEVMPDFLHLSSRGYRIWADAIEPTLWEMMEET